MNAKPELTKWLTEECRITFNTLQDIPYDASFRRYYRVQDKHQSYILMDASAEHEKCLPFTCIARALKTQGLCVPEIFHSDFNQGFLLISDFGNKVLLHELNNENAVTLYSQALEALAVLQNCRQVEGYTIPPFTAEFMRQELDWYKNWFLKTHLELAISPTTDKVLNKCFDFLAEAAATQPQVFMHRDYHSANLMVLPENKLGILDFQDAFMGPVTYDLVSLLRDCYIAWPESLVTQLALQYRDQIDLKISNDEFIRWFDLMGLQRHLKALMTYSRKLHRDNNPNYLQHIPRAVDYIATIGERYAECEMLCALMNEAIICVQ